MFRFKSPKLARAQCCENASVSSKDLLVLFSWHFINNLCSALSSQVSTQVENLGKNWQPIVLEKWVYGWRSFHHKGENISLISQMSPTFQIQHSNSSVPAASTWLLKGVGHDTLIGFHSCSKMHLWLVKSPNTMPLSLHYAPIRSYQKLSMEGKPEKWRQGLWQARAH